jgi:uncharacterized phage infection (PIP) family protein YhgE
MTNSIETDLVKVLEKIDSKIDKLDEKLEKKFDKLSEDINDLKVGQAKLEGKIDALDEKFSGQNKALDNKVDQLDKRISNSEFTNRGILIGLVVIILGGAAKLFGLIGK